MLSLCAFFLAFVQNTLYLREKGVCFNDILKQKKISRKKCKN